MNHQKIKWIICQSIDQLTKIDLIIAFLGLFSVFSYLLVLPQYEQNLDAITAENAELQREVKRNIKQQDIQNIASKTLTGTPLIEISKSYQYANAQVLDAKYDPQNQQVQLQLQGEISNLIDTTNHLKQYQNIQLLSLSLVQDDLKKQPNLNIIWQVQEQT
ncbi:MULTISPECIES: hypothetical protein [unclassified Acinetobacter]|uniref:hypothetical protein n=1 Tax=unclassified Acinetobacter TaxID=196816 RepID=UPI00244AFC74|nr:MULTISPECIES: hypothetical protein [unclassified Acinetobacter]MDH0032173.1 hypothetical protein [Acinetobacter sp. GD04021]MDH0886052.1 hypothetical protein [Acinetobacter sp. GD03873]MDH1082672.1 hypothetical protein [Acinetobacter sp. GD03983]MDH2189533.1 hypothetical protein [Acinetobacter sp. GD03645]MDH2203636.1 hypothetical protein [Acinetobacter sp. GD03647]